MLTATLGGLIKDYRIKKRLSQLDVSMQIGWSDTSRLSKIEQGRVGKPSRENVEKIISALRLDDQERGEFLLVGGYETTEEEILQVIKDHKNRISEWPYPAHLIDFSGRILFVNEPEYEALGATTTLRKEVERRTHPLEWAFADKPLWQTSIYKGDSKKTLKNYRTSKVANFKVNQAGRETEKWYKQLIKKLSSNKEFREIWVSADIEEAQHRLKDYEYKELVDSNGKRRKYHVFTSRLVIDPRFSFVFYVPA